MKNIKEINGLEVIYKGHSNYFGKALVEVFKNNLNLNEDYGCRPLSLLMGELFSKVDYSKEKEKLMLDMLNKLSFTKNPFVSLLENKWINISFEEMNEEKLQVKVYKELGIKKGWEIALSSDDFNYPNSVYNYGTIYVLENKFFENIILVEPRMK